MKKLSIALFSTLCLISCKDDDSSIYWSLTEFERTLIPFEDSTVIEFENQSSEQIAVNVSAKNVTTADVGSHEGDYQTEYIENEFGITPLLQRLKVNIRKGRNGAPHFFIHAYFANGKQELLGINNCGTGQSLDLQSLPTKIMVNDVVYEDVFDFLPCASAEFNISRIIYSITNGIEYIAYNDGSYLQQIRE